MGRCKNYLMLSVATIAAIVMRLIMAFFITDQKSGFVNSENIAYALFIVLIILAAAVAVFLQVFFGKKENFRSADFEGAPRIVISILLSFAVILDIGVNKTGVLVPVWMARLYVAVAVVFIAYLIFSAFKKETEPLLSVIPVVFWLLRLVMTFIEFSSISNTVDNIIELVTLGVILIFFLTYSKAICLDADQKLLRNLNALSFLSCYMAFITAVPKAVIVFSGHAGILHQNNRSFLLTLLTGVYILFFVFQNNKKA